MIKRYNNLSFLLFIPGAFIQIAGLVMQESSATESSQGLGAVLIVIGSLLAVAGLGCYALAKGRSPLWCVAGLIGLPGILILALLKDKSGDPWNT